MSSTPARDPDLLKELVEFWSNTGTDCANPGDGLRGAWRAGTERSELQALIARKRHHDAVRLTELNLLRRIRQQGLTGDQIREMERALVSASSSPGPAPPGSTSGRATPAGAAVRAPERHLQGEDATTVGPRPKGADHASAASAGETATAHAPDPAQGTVHPTFPGRTHVEEARCTDPDGAGGDDHQEVQHDTELDQAAVAFANADFGGCESALRELIGPGGERQHHAPTWRALLDLYRATGQQAEFERLALAYTRDLQQTPPQWVSIPRLAMNMNGRPSGTRSAAGGASEAAGRAAPAWQCPTLLDGSAISSMLTPRPTGQGAPVVDWTSAKVLTHDGAQSLLDWLLAHAEDTAQQLLWKGTSTLLDLLRDTPRSEGRPEDEVLWRLRLTILRLMGVQGPYDLVAMDFKSAYGRDAPTWDPAAARIVDAELGQPSAFATGADFSAPSGYDRRTGPSDTTVELVGQLTGNITDTLARTLADIPSSRSVQISCARLIRVDLMAAGELLNWVSARAAQGRRVRFIEVHRLLAVFFCAVGLDDQATIELRPL